MCLDNITFPEMPLKPFRDLLISSHDPHAA
jgi:hypothetical protein